MIALLVQASCLHRVLLSHSALDKSARWSMQAMGFSCSTCQKMQVPVGMGQRVRRMPPLSDSAETGWFL